jgi:hypothetical protein
LIKLQSDRISLNEAEIAVRVREGLVNIINKASVGHRVPRSVSGGRPDRYLIWARVGQRDTWILGRCLGSICI